MRNRSTLTRLFWLSAALCVAAGVLSAQSGVVQRISFKRGSTSATVKGAVVRGTRDHYTIGARRGQRMTLRLTSLEQTAEFQLYPSQVNIAESTNGEPPDQTLVQMNSRGEETHWSGNLPATGDYRIVVGPTRGNATYNLEVAIRNDDSTGR